MRKFNVFVPQVGEVFEYADSLSGRKVVARCIPKLSAEECAKCCFMSCCTAEEDNSSSVICMPPCYEVAPNSGNVVFVEAVPQTLSEILFGLKVGKTYMCAIDTDDNIRYKFDPSLDSIVRVRGTDTRELCLDWNARMLFDAVWYEC